MYWGERSAEGLTALRPGADRDPGVGTMTYVQEAEVGGMQVKIWVPAGAAHLDNLDLSNLISAAQKAGIKEVYLGAGGYGRRLLFRLPIENADKEGMTEAARSLLPELDVCDTDGVVELTAELLSGDLDAVTLSYVCKNGEMQVDTSAEDDYGTPHPDPQLAAELLEETRQ